MKILHAIFPAALILSCAHTAENHPAQNLEAIVSSPDRTEADRALDEGRKPLKFLEFMNITPGMQVAELMAGGGYTTELLSRAVGPTGRVYGENPKIVLEKFAEKPWSERLKRVSNVSRLDQELDDAFPKQLEKSLDLVVSNAIYHDTVWLGSDRAKMNAAVFAALKPGGAYIVCDSSAKEGTGLDSAKDLHRIDERFVREEVLKAGFTFEAEGAFLRNPSDTRDWSASPGAAGAKRGTGDRFCFRFIRPVEAAAK